MSLIDKLLSTDAGKLTEKPFKIYEVPRLSEKLGMKFEVRLEAVPPQRYAEIQRQAIDFSKKGNFKDVNMFDPKITTLLAGIKEPDLKDNRLLDHFGAVTPKELIMKLFLAGEIDDIRNEIDTLSGYEKDEEEADEEIKN